MDVTCKLKIIETELNDRIIKFVEFDTTTKWINDFPREHWCLIIIANEKKPRYFQEILRKSIDRDVGYICAVGKQHQLIHNIADEEIVIREVEISNNHLPGHLIITVGEEDFEKGIWFGLNLTDNPETEIKEILILDLTNESFKKTVDLIKRLEKGYFPAE